jgi:hypothetical protein
MLKEVVERPSVEPTEPKPPKELSQFRKPVQKQARPEKTSAFARKAREHTASNDKAGPSRPRQDVKATSIPAESPNDGSSTYEKNTAKIAAMTDDEREQELEELKARFGGGVLEMMRKRVQRKRDEGRNNAVGLAREAEDKLDSRGSGSAARRNGARSGDIPEASSGM